MAFDATTYARSKKYTDTSIEGTTGVIAGKNCTIESVVKEDGVNTVTFKWTADNGDVRRTTMRVNDGVAGKGIIGVSIDENNYIVITYVDGTTTTSDNPIPQPDIMQGATSLLDGEAGLVPKPLSGDIGYLNSRGEWDSSISEKVETLEETIPTDDIPEGATLTADGWTITNDNEVSNEFAKWEG